MVQSVHHEQTREQHQTHLLYRHRAWLFMLFVVLIALVSFLLGYFDSVSWTDVILAILFTAYRLFVAFGVALALGLCVGLLVGASPLSDYLFPVFDVLQNIPSFALIPFFIGFFGYTDQMIILFAITAMTWPILFAILAAIRGAHDDLNSAATIFGARGLRRIPFYLAPLVFPAVLSGSIVSIAVGWEAVIGAEIISNISGGFGEFILEAGAAGPSPTAVAGILVILIFVFEVNRLIWAPRLRENAKMYAK